MARRKKEGGFEAVVKLLALMPWWLCLLLGAVAYFVFDRLAVPVPPPVLQDGANHMQALPKAAAAGLIAGLSAVLKVVAPLVCVVAAVASLIARSKRKTLLSQAQEVGSASLVSGMTWQDFELLVGEAYRRQGYIVQETAAGADGGIDLVMHNQSGEKYIVQCKFWRATRVGVPVVRELYGAMAACGAAGAKVVTSGSFTAEAKAFAEGRNISLVDGKALSALIGSAKARGAGGSEPRKPQSSQTQPEGATKVCPVCSGVMVKRKARRGGNSGNIFWGCLSFPECRGVLPDE